RAAVEQMPRDWTVRTTGGDDPKAAVVRLARNPDGCIKLTLEPREVTPGRRIDRDPFVAHVVGGYRGDFVSARISEQAGDIHLVMARDQRLSPGLPVHAQDRGLVAANRTLQEPGISGPIDMRRPGRKGIVGLDRYDFFKGGAGPLQNRGSRAFVSGRHR